MYVFKLTPCMIAVLAVTNLSLGSARGDIIVPVSGSTSSPITAGAISNVLDGVINFDSYLQLGPQENGSFSGPHSVLFDLGGRYDLIAFNLWNNAGNIEFDGEGIKSFTLRFLNPSMIANGTFNGTAIDTLTQQSFAFSAADTAFVELVINSNHQEHFPRAYVELYEINFNGTAAVPEPNSLLLAGSGLMVIAVFARRRAKERCKPSLLVPMP